MKISLLLLSFAVWAVTLRFAGASSPNFLENEYAGGWFVEPPGFGRWIPHPDHAEREVLELESPFAGPYWSLGGLSYDPAIPYELSVRVRALPGVVYRCYAAANLKDGQKAFVAWGQGSGAWQSHKIPFQFAHANGTYTEKAYFVIELRSGGELQVAEVEVRELPGPNLP